MWVAAQPRIAATNVSTLRPGRAPPTRSTNRTVWSINASKPRRTINVAGTINPASATNVSSSKVASKRSISCDLGLWEVPPWLAQQRRQIPSLSQLRRPFWWMRQPPDAVNRWTEAKDLSG